MPTPAPPRPPPRATPSPQALPRLTHMAIRLPETLRLTQPHTALRSLTLTMTWPVHLATLLPGLPNLEVVRAVVFLNAYEYSDDNAGVVALYDNVAAMAAALESVRHVELQLSVMLRERWEWCRVVREVAAVRGLRGPQLRMPQRDSGPQLRAPHFVNICRCGLAGRRGARGGAEWQPRGGGR